MVVRHQRNESGRIHFKCCRDVQYGIVAKQASLYQLLEDVVKMLTDYRYVSVTLSRNVVSN